ncbi:MAG: L,D-transpeptidase family protein [Giesbergeria sp.]|jgi:murein L,D-transpeptidase YcbB/YkuD|nr:L,D-transpeptidase family protein [Giesbergeria sp.]
MRSSLTPKVDFLRPLVALWLSCLGMAAMAGAFVDAGRPTPAAWQATEVLADAGAEGLLPQDYDAGALTLAVTGAAQGPALDEAAAAGLETALTTALHRYLTDLHTGRIDPRHIQANFTASPPPPFDPAATLQAALTAPHLADALRAAAPRIPLYAQLRAALAHYRTLTGHPAWATPLPPLPGKRKLEPGQAWAGLPLLAQRLVVLGDLPEGTLAATTYDEILQSGVKTFQQRHALAADGVVGKGTLEQLNISPERRAHQITLALERLRWTPLQQAPRMIVVNVPEFVLRAYEMRDGMPAVALTMNVIVGKSVQTHTPLFDEPMRFIEFSPYWNVPPSIARAETVPRLRRDSAYFTQQGFEFVNGTGQAVTTLSDAHLDAVLSGKMRLRQRPGPRNALGDIKFVFPNHSNIYLHHTPAPQLFARERRDFSHGCIRIEDPVALARFVLQDDPAWTPERIREAMGRGQSHTVALPQPVPVVLAYSTTIVKNGRLHFFADIYRHDQQLEQALRRNAQARQAQRPAP